MAISFTYRMGYKHDAGENISRLIAHLSISTE